MTTNANTTSPVRTLSPDIGQTENVLRALLERLLAPSATTYVQWVTLSVLARGRDAQLEETLSAEVCNGIKCDLATATAALEVLHERGLIARVGEQARNITLTAAGDRFVQELRQSIAAITEQVYGGLAPEDLATTQRVLSQITERANAALRRM
jgi:DNA-binding MarR family transcriptional regulator